jgi:uncharacterized protein (DUF2141 family)
VIPPAAAQDFPLPVVLLVDEKPRDLLRSGWEDLAKRVGFVVIALPKAYPSVFPTVLEEVKSTTRTDPNRLYLVSSDLLPARVLPNLAALATESTEETVAGIARYIVRGKPDTRKIWAFFDRNPRKTGTPVPTRLTIHVTGLRNKKGSVSLTLYRGSEGFRDPQKAYLADTLPILGSSIMLPFAQLPPDDYAILVLHDENGNSKMDTSLGFPREGFGSSNNPKPRFGPPSFEETRFAITGDTPERHIVIQIVYL